MATPSVGKKTFTLRRFGAGFGSDLGSGFGVGVWSVDSMARLNHYNAFTTSAQKIADVVRWLTWAHQAIPCHEFTL
jgi:hypothetical protein